MMRKTGRTPPPRRGLCPVPAAVLAAAGVLALSAGCARVPELAATIRSDLRDSDYPELRPIESLAEPLPAPAEAAAGLEASLEWRRRALERRARALRQPVVDGRSRTRMETGMARGTDAGAGAMPAPGPVPGPVPGAKDKEADG